MKANLYPRPYEPAEKLLERIKAVKAKREADKKPKRQSTIKSKQPRKSKTTATDSHGEAPIQYGEEEELY